MMSNRGRFACRPGTWPLPKQDEYRFVSRLPAGEVGVVRQVVDQLADHETVVELGRHGDVTSVALSCVGPGQRRVPEVASRTLSAKNGQTGPVAEASGAEPRSRRLRCAPPRVGASARPLPRKARPTRASALLAQAPQISNLIRQARRPIQLPARGTDRQRIRPPAGVARDGFASRDAPAVSQNLTSARIFANSRRPPYTLLTFCW
jgi:hypothetical protein